MFSSQVFDHNHTIDLDLCCYCQITIIKFFCEELMVDMIVSKCFVKTSYLFGLLLHPSKAIRAINSH